MIQFYILLENVDTEAVRSTTGEGDERCRIVIMDEVPWRA